MKLRAVEYIRVSMERDGMISPEIQHTAIQDHCDKFGYSIVATLEDLDESGRFWKRRKVEQAIKMIENREADVIVVWKISRVARNRKDWAIALDRVESIGGKLESATEPMDTSNSSGRFARGVLAELAVFESERIGDSWKESHARRIKKGLPHHGTPRFGYDYSKETGYVPNEVSGPVLAEMYRRFIAGSSIYEVSRYAVSEGLDKPNGWRMSHLRRMLDKGFGAGYIVVKGELVKGAHEPVISEEEWQAYLVRRDIRKGSPRSESTDYPYSGILRCYCGSRMTGARLTRSGREYRRYICTEAQQKLVHKQVSISENLIDVKVLEWLDSIAAEVNSEAAKKVAPNPAKQGLVRRAAQVRTDLARNEQRIDALTIKYLDGDVTKEVHDRLMEKLVEERSALTARQRLVQDNSTAEPAKIVPDLLAQWEKLPGRGKREILRRLLEKIQLHDWEDGQRKIDVQPVWSVGS